MQTDDTQPTPETQFSNRQADLAYRAGVAFRRYRRASLEAHESFLEAGAALAEARSTAKRGQWAPFLARAGIPERTARSMLRLASAGVKPATVAVKGIRGTLEFIAICERDLTKWPPGANPDGDCWRFSRAEFEAMTKATDWLPLIGRALNEITMAKTGGADQR